MPRRRETPRLSSNHQDVRLVVPRTADADAEVLQVDVEGDRRAAATYCVCTELLQRLLRGMLLQLLLVR